MGRRKAPQFDSTDQLLDARVTAELDLHGCERHETERLVKGFLEDWSRRSPGCVVRIITGKGSGSPNGSVLGPAVRTVLKTKCATLVADYAADHAGGAFLVKVR